MFQKEVATGCAVFFKKAVLQNIAKLNGKHLYQISSLKMTLVQVFSYKFSKIFNNNFFTEHLWVTPSGSYDYGFILKEVMLADAEVFCL